MSIPKEPRQLMINLMYLVLTAMLALNVSAEIINAFFALNKGIKTSNEIVEKSNNSIKAAIDKQADAYKNPANESYKSLAAQTQKISKDFESYVNGVTDKLVEAAGGVNKEFSDGRPVRIKDKDVTTRMFLNEKKGEELQQKIADQRKAFLDLIKDPKDRADLEKQIALQVDSIPKDSKAKTWSELKFKQMPVAAVMPMLTKLIADNKTSETALMNYFFNKIGGDIIKFENFKVAIAPKKSYLIRGDKFEADIYLAAYSSNPGTNVSITANGSGLPLNQGVAHYETTPDGIGKKMVNATASVRNPLTGQTTTVQGTFEYEVGEKSGTISAEKMNVLYIGVENPVAVSAAGTSSNTLKLSCSGCESVSKQNDNNYIVKVNKEGKATMTLSGDNGFTVNKEFRVKRIPNPVPVLSVDFDRKSNFLGSGQMAANSGVIAKLENFDFEAKCSVQSYVLVRVQRREDPQQCNVSGPTNAEAERLCRQAKAGDFYQFLNIKARCPGDVIARDVGSISYYIK